MVGFATLKTMGLCLKVVNGESRVSTVMLFRASRIGHKATKCRGLMVGRWRGVEGLEGVMWIGLRGVSLPGLWRMCLH